MVTSASTVDTVPTNVFGNYSCTICGKKYATVNLLGEHFFLSHNNYEELLILDENSKTEGFPGFELLRFIGMIDIYGDKETDRIMAEERYCSLCYTLYKRGKLEYNSLKYQDLMVTVDDIKKSNYFSDTDVDYHKQIIRLIKHNVSIENHKTDIYKIIVLNDLKLIDKYNKLRTKQCLPLELQCCRTFICFDCCKNHLNTTNSVICPFCKKDHTQGQLDYIKMVEPADELIHESWYRWWLKD
jgi:hypothetical protein